MQLKEVLVQLKALATGSLYRALLILTCYRGAEPPKPRKVLRGMLGEVPARGGVLRRVLGRVLGKVLGKVLEQP